MHRSDTLWAEPEVKQWLQQTLRSALPIFADKSNGHVSFGLRLWRQSLYPNNAVPQGILRHVLVSDIQPLRSFLPQSVLNSMGFTFDPLPPGPGFDDEYFKSMYEGGRKVGGSRSENSASSHASDRDDNGDFVQRLMQYLQTGGEGGRGLDPDTEAAVVAQLEQLAMAGSEDALPGDFPGAHDEEDDEDSDRPAAANGGVMDFFRGLWQTNAQAQGQADNEEADSDSVDGDDGEAAR